MLKLVLAVGISVVLFGRGASAQNVPFSMGPGGLHYGMGHFGPGVQFGGEHIVGTRGTGRFRARASADPHAVLSRRETAARANRTTAPTHSEPAREEHAAPPARAERAAVVARAGAPTEAAAAVRSRAIGSLFSRRKGR